MSRRRSNRYSRNRYYDEYECIANFSDDDASYYTQSASRRRRELYYPDRYYSEHKEPYSSPEEEIIIISKSPQKYSASLHLGVDEEPTSLPLAVRETKHRKVEKRATNAIEADIRRELQQFVDDNQDGD